MSDLTFVIQEGAPGGICPELKKKVRSHAMRDYRRRKREAGSYPLREFQNPSQSGTQGVLILKKGLNQTEYLEQYPISFNSGPSITIIDGQTPINLDENESSSWMEMISPIERPLSSIFRTKLLSQQEYGRIFHRINWWLFNHTVSGSYGQNSVMAQSWRRMLPQCMIESEMVLLASSLLFCINPSPAFNNPESAEGITLKGLALRHIRKEVERSNCNPDMNLIIAITCLSTSEIASGSPQANAHLDALGRILGLRKNSLKFRDDNPIVLSLAQYVLGDAQFLAVETLKIFRQDHFNAISNDSAPRFIKVPMINLHLSTRLGIEEDATMSSPLLLSNSSHIEPCSPGIISPELAKLLKEAYHMTELRSLATLPFPTDQSPFSTTDTERIREFLDTFPIVNHSFLYPITRACYFASQIHFRANVELIPYGSIQNDQSVMSLVKALEQTKVNDWEHMPFVYLWIITTGAAAAQTRNQTRYFTGKSTQFSFIYALHYFEVYSRTQNNFLWLQDCIRRSKEYM